MKSKQVRWMIECGAWMVFIGIPLFFIPSLENHIGKEKVMPVLFSAIATHLYLIGFYYFNYFFALPKYYFSKKYHLYFPLVISCLLLIILIMLSNDLYNPLKVQDLAYGKLIFLFSIVIRFIMVFLLSLGLLSYSRLRVAEEERIKNELNLLKAQVNPHFLFNTLNSIYALSVKKSDRTPESVTRLASIMRYVISDTSAEFVDLGGELKYISDYIDLERLRLTEKVKLDFKVEGDAAGKRIAPLIFVPLIENAFRYGVSTTEDADILLNIVIRGNTLEVITQNTINQTSKPGNGTGIANMKKRLELIYPGNHTLSLIKEQDRYKAKLKIELK